MFRRKCTRQPGKYLKKEILRNKILDMKYNVSTVNFMSFLFFIFFLLGFCIMIFGGRRYVEGFWYLKEESLLIFIKEQSGGLFYYIWKKRSLLYLGLVFIGVMKHPKGFSWGVIVLCGVLFGVFASELFLVFGNNGLFLGMLMIFPYMICYILGGGMILKRYICSVMGEHREGTVIKKIGGYVLIYLLFFLGMLIECYYFPWILRIVYVAFCG